MRPVAAGFCRYESLLDGSISLTDVLKMNVYLDNRSHNEHLLRKLQHGTS